MTLILPTLPLKFRIGFGNTHSVPDGIVGLRLREDITAAAGPDWYACVILSNSRGVFVPSRPDIPHPDGDHLLFLRELAFALNYRVAYEGHWVLAWVAPKKFYAIWRDGDGDMHAIMEDERDWSQMSGSAYGVDTYVNQADRALQMVAEQASRLEVSKWQQHKRAQGEAAPRTIN